MDPTQEARELYQQLQAKLAEAEQLNELDRRNQIAEKAAYNALLEDEVQKQAETANPDMPITEAQALEAFRSNKSPETVNQFYDARARKIMDNLNAEEQAAKQKLAELQKAFKQDLGVNRDAVWQAWQDALDAENAASLARSQYDAGVL